MAKSSPRKLRDNLKHVSAYGDRAEHSHLRMATIMLYAFTIFTALIYIVTAGANDMEGTTGDDEMKGKAFTYICVIAGVSIILLMLEFYPTLNDTMKLFRLGVVITSLVFVGLAIPKVVDLSDGTDAASGSKFSFAALTLAFGGLASLINIMEIFRKSDF